MGREGCGRRLRRTVTQSPAAVPAGRKYYRRHDYEILPHERPLSFPGTATISIAAAVTPDTSFAVDLAMSDLAIGPSNLLI